MAKYEKGFDSEDSYTVFEAGNNLWGHNIARHSCDKDMANRLVKNQFHRYARIGTGQYRGEGLLLAHCSLFQDGQIVLDRCQLICGETLVACEQFLESRIGTQVSLGAKPFWSG
jgi:hypothetical protein